MTAYDGRVDKDGYGKVQIDGTWRAVVPFSQLNSHQLVRANQGSGDIFKGGYNRENLESVDTCTNCHHPFEKHRKIKSTGEIFCLAAACSCQMERVKN